MQSPVIRVPVVRLLERSPFERLCWPDMSRPVTLQEVAYAIEEKRFRDQSFSHEVDWSVLEYTNDSHNFHVERIAYLVLWSSDNPIQIGMGQCWFVNDGSHRLGAAIYRNDETIDVTFVGSESQLTTLIQLML